MHRPNVRVMMMCAAWLDPARKHTHMTYRLRVLHRNRPRQVVNLCEERGSVCGCW